MYATAAARSDGLLLLCGGRDTESTPMGDAYGLARHRDGRWEWAAAPGDNSQLASRQPSAHPPKGLLELAVTKMPQILLRLPAVQFGYCFGDIYYTLV